MSPEQSKDGWKYMPKNQARECISCGNRITLNNYAWFNTRQEWTKCRDCWPRTITFQPCGCAYCATVEAAVEDAREHHRRAEAHVQAFKDIAEGRP